MDNKKTVIKLDPIIQDLALLTQTFRALCENLIESPYAGEVLADAWMMPIRQLCELVERADSLIENIPFEKGEGNQ